MKKPTYKVLAKSHRYYADQVNFLTAEVNNQRTKFEAEKKEWLEAKLNRELDLKATIVKASAQMIEALAKMIGGPGF